MPIGGVSKISMAVAFMAMASAYAATFTVSKDGRGGYTSIQAAVDKAGKGDSVKILDAAEYLEQVTIDSNKHGLTLASSNPTALAKPKIKWQDKVHQGPRSCAEALVPAKIDFDQNGALRLLRVRNITIDGIAVDGGGTAPFSWPSVWGDGITCNGKTYPNFHGNGAIALFVSGGVTVRNCDISNAFFGLAIKDRNEGGIFANVNPGDLEKSNVIPLSGFGKTGNHVFEKNRIHNNTWGFFFESAWDLGSTARYNLIYENHHATAQIAAAVKAMADGEHHPGGGFLFKDVMLSPISVYNNTFWHNYQIFSAGYKPGAQHLIFNNIYGKPYLYFMEEKTYGNTFHILDPRFVNRMKHSVYSVHLQPIVQQSRTINFNHYDQGAQTQLNQAVDVKFYNSIRIMDNMGSVANENFPVSHTFETSAGPVTKSDSLTNINLPCGQIVAGNGSLAFPAAANIRWYEIAFSDTVPSSPGFLTPDWEDPLVKKCVMNAGWPEAGIYNSDGKVADLGAVPSVERPTEDVRIQPLSPVLINGTKATLNFSLSGAAGQLQSPRIKYIKLVRALPLANNSTTGDFGGIPGVIVPAPVDVTPSTTTLQMGSNTITATFSAPFPATEKYAFFEIIAEGIGANGQLVTTNVGFLPYRTLDKKFKVEVLGADGNPTSSVSVGEAVKLRITPQSLDGVLFPDPIGQTEVSLGSMFDLLTTGNPPVKFVLSSITGITTKDVMFTKIPPGGLEYVNATGIAKIGGLTYVFFGGSDPITILPAAPEKVVFQSPPSRVLNPGSFSVVDPGVLFPVKVEVRDRFDNIVKTPVTVTIKSMQPDIGVIDGSLTATTDSSGIATFTAKVGPQGDLNELFDLVASIPAKTPDTASLKVGKARDRLWILYADTKVYNPAAELRGSAGDRLPVTIRAGQDANTVLPTRLTQFTITGTPGLTIYASPTAIAKTDTFNLTNGEVVVYVTGLRQVDKGSLFVVPTTDNTILRGDRGEIYFTFVPSAVLSASFHADNGLAAVDRVEITFRADLKRAPDSVDLAWPGPGLNPIRIKAPAFDPANPRRLSLKLPVPFPAGLSTGTGAGSVYTFDPATPDIPVQAGAFTGADSVGPLLDSGLVLERDEAGPDTLYIGFNEKTSTAGLLGTSLILIKAGNAPITLSILSAVEVPGKGWRITLADLGAQAPVPGDSLRINGAGPLTDALGNRAHALNRPIALKLKPKPREAVLNLRMDKPFLGVKGTVQQLDFLVLSANPDSSWKPVLGSLPGGLTGSCASLPCGELLHGTLDRPAFILETDRGLKYSVMVFSNLGEYVNGFTGEITNAQLGLDERNLPVSGATSEFTRGAKGRYAITIAWNAKAHNGTRAGTGAYIAKIAAVSKAENGDGKAIRVPRSKAVRFGLLRN